MDFQGRSELKIHNLSNAVGLDYDYESGCLYWTEVTKLIKLIRRHCPENNYQVNYLIKIRFDLLFSSIFKI